MAALGFAALTSGTGSNSSTAGNQAHGGSSSSPTSPKTSSSSGTSDQAAAMEQFIASYLSTVTSDDHATFDMLTPQYQVESGHYGGYHGFWKTVRSATPHNVTVDPAAMTVTYDVDYVTDNGGTTTDHVTLQLVKNGRRACPESARRQRAVYGPDDAGRTRPRLTPLRAGACRTSAADSSGSPDRSPRSIGRRHTGVRRGGSPCAT